MGNWPPEKRQSGVAREQKAKKGEQSKENCLVLSDIWNVRGWGRFGYAPSGGNPVVFGQRFSLLALGIRCLNMNGWLLFLSLVHQLDVSSQEAYGMMPS